MLCKSGQSTWHRRADHGFWILHYKAVTAVVQVRWALWGGGSCLTKTLWLYWDSCTWKIHISLCYQISQILDFHSIFPVESVYIDHIICTQFRSVIMSRLLSPELPNLLLISSAIKRSQFPKMASCFIYTNRDMFLIKKKFHNMQKGKWLLSHPILLSKIIFGGLGFWDEGFK